jgi:hypothetical protein
MYLIWLRMKKILISRSSSLILRRVMSDDQFAKLFKYMEKRFGVIEKKLDQKADRVQVDRIYALLDEDLQRRETDDQERTFMNHQLDRHEGWIARAAKRLGVSYER